ncbi:BsuPI-related putative proteinase inhibitor [Evansella cellulosilytica]|uniref:Intracellular proteinase inhibitor BsuPI domain-containing protein n=1 Tax=Evansella cellulosilytica (strain ATCC 21833 / DSM 2522 / FERM P-1141 / JCM 9156 / N-4) TaxID=649639 RepID=E6TXZ4_EVAC2|nr:BsuPI-related putative proteinase inhibitor [Evansella cellulosilytica]ADU31207.1 hypothetical protein Bcell_2956 [Evansella cellulosilytica DSM 2522]
MKKFVIMVCMLSFITACGTGEGEESTESVPVTGQGEQHTDSENNDIDKEEKQGDQGGESMEYRDFLYSVDASLEDNALQVSITLKNEAESARKLEFSSGHQFDIIVKDQEGNVIYDYAADRMFTQAFIFEEVGESEALTFNDQWYSESLGDYEVLQVEATLLPFAIDDEEVEKGDISLTVTLTK